MEIQEIKQRLSIEAVLNHYGLQANRNHMLKCPFHEEKEPSLKIYPNTNTFNCFGCKANGDTIEFIQLKEKCNKHEALKRATELINPIEIKLQPTKPKEEPTKPRRKDTTTYKTLWLLPWSNQQQQTIKKLHYTNQAFRIVFRNRLQLCTVPPWTKA